MADRYSGYWSDNQAMSRGGSRGGGGTVWVGPETQGTLGEAAVVVVAPAAAGSEPECFRLPTMTVVAAVVLALLPPSC